MKNNLFHAFTQKPFLLLWLGEFFTQIAVNFFNFFLILLVFKLTESNTAVSGIVITFTIPAILFGVLAGVYTDRWHKKSVLLVTNLIRVGLLCVLALFHTNIYVIYTISLLIAVATQFFIPAETPMIPLVVTKQDLLSANALFGMGIYGSMLIAYILSGSLLLQFGTVGTILFIAGLLLLGAGCIALIEIPQRTQKESLKKYAVTRAVTHEIREVFGVITANKQIYTSVFFLALSQILMLLIAAIAPGYAEQVLKIRVEDFPTLFMIPAAIGVVIGAVILVNFRLLRYGTNKIISLGLLLAGFAMLVMPYGSAIVSREFVQTINESLVPQLQITNIHILGALAFLLGLANALIFVPANTTLQERTSDEIRGKVYGVMNMIVGIFSLLPIVIVGSISDLIGVDKVIVGLGFMLIVFSVFHAMSEAPKQGKGKRKSSTI